MSLYLPDLELEVPVIGIVGIKKSGKTSLLQAIQREVPGTELPRDIRQGYLTDTNRYFVDLGRTRNVKSPFVDMFILVNSMARSYSNSGMEQINKGICGENKPVLFAATRRDLFEKSKIGTLTIESYEKSDFGLKSIFKGLFKGCFLVSSTHGGGIVDLVEKAVFCTEELGLPRVKKL